MNVLHSTWLHGTILAAVSNLCTASTNLLYISFDDQTILTAVLYQHAGKAALIVKRQLIQLGTTGCQRGKGLLFSWQSFRFADGLVEMILYAGMV